MPTSTPLAPLARLARRVFLAGTAAALLAACATTPQIADEADRDLPPILAQDEIFRPYVKIGTVEVNLKRYGRIEELQQEAEEWARDALSIEASKIGADAVILPEVRIEKNTYIIFPVMYVKGKGTAVKFQ
ncbi:hypothetical protein A2G06_11430 [Geobacter anodireducens]|nr:hypothetical protein A2G06_11430 [Geobacter anodireducens]